MLGTVGMLASDNITGMGPISQIMAGKWAAF
jgi:hypothetical protein